MRRLSARTVIAIPWLATLTLVVLAARLGWGFAVAAWLAGAGFALALTSYVTSSLRTLSRDIRNRATPLTSRPAVSEVDAVARAIHAAAADAKSVGSAAVLAEQRLLAVIESITEGIVQVSSNARFVHVNPAARELLNLPADAVGQSVAAAVRHPELRQSIERAAAGHSYDPVEILVDDRHLLVSPRPLRSARAGSLPGTVVAIVDLTEIRRLESVRRDFVANVSHELKTPLTSIHGYTETLLNDDMPPEMRKQFLEVVFNNTQRIQRIVDDLLDLSRLQSGGWQPNLQQVDPAGMAEDVWPSCLAAHRKQIGFSVVVRSEGDVVADPDGLRHVFSNLFDNAIRYTPAGGEVSVTIQAADHVGNGGARAQRYLELVVADTGTGIPRESLPRIFERFYRVDPARSRQEGGTGLGLSIVKHLVESMAGEVSAESELGKGTAIHIKLPAA
jgi:two-component system phosphate regulon sensor histidine kinase PhoR